MLQHTTRDRRCCRRTAEPHVIEVDTFPHFLQGHIGSAALPTPEQAPGTVAPNGAVIGRGVGLAPFLLQRGSPGGNLGARKLRLSKRTFFRISIVSRRHEIARDRSDMKIAY